MQDLLTPTKLKRSRIQPLEEDSDLEEPRRSRIRPLEEDSDLEDTKSKTEPPKPEPEENSSSEYLQSSEDDGGYVRPKRVKCLTEHEQVIAGLATGNDAPLQVREGGISGRGVFATAAIAKGDWLCEYKTTRVFPLSEKAAVEEEYDLNDEGSYIVETGFPVPNEGHLCWDATRKYHQVGRDLNHAKRANAKISAPCNIRGKWRIGFVACRDIAEGDEVVWDYGVRDQVWSSCRLVDGVVQKTPAMEGGRGESTEESEGEAKGGASGEAEKEKEKVGLAPRRSKENITYCMCPICKTGPHKKISNHLAQTHHLSARQRAQYLGPNRIIATPGQMQVKKSRPTLPAQKSQRTIKSIFEAMTSPQVPPVGTPSPVRVAGEEVASSDSELPDSPDSPPRCPSPPGVSLTLSPPPTGAGLSDRSTSVAVESAGPSSASLSGKYTRNAPRFALDEAFLVVLDEYLGSRSGGKKDATQRREICVDILKFLHFANSDTCNPDFLLSRETIRRFVTWLEEGGIGPSGVLSKLRHIKMAITCLGHQHEDWDTEVEFCTKRDMVMSLLSSIRLSLDKEKRKVQVTKLDEFTHHIPELGEISQFISSRRVQNFLDEVCAKAQAGQDVPGETLQECTFLIAGRLMLRNAQRPGIISGMTLGEYEEASQPSPDTLVVLVRSHKGSRPARVVASDRTITELAMWANTLRPLFVQEDSPLLFCTRQGGRLLHISRKLSDLAKSFGSTIPPATAVRKAIATAGGALGEGEKSALAHSMSHSKSTADSYYRAYGEAKSVNYISYYSHN